MPSPLPASPVALIDIGTTSLRMTIAQVEPGGAIKPLEYLQQAISLGKDTFLKGIIEKGSIEECVRVLQKFRHVLDEYGITREEAVHAIATTAVREAQNRDAFIDRVYMATGFPIEVLEDRDVVRMTYRSAREVLRNNPGSLRGQIIICEMGGGSTELLVMHRGGIILSQSFRLGSLRLREMLEKFNAPVKSQRTYMENEINRTIDQIIHALPEAAERSLIALGSDIRFAAHQLLPNYDPLGTERIKLQQLEKFTKESLSLAVNDTVRAYHLSFPEAETLAPNLLFFTLFCRALHVKSLLVSGISMQNGALLEMSRSNAPDDDFKAQILSSAWETARKYRSSEAHVKQVMLLCGRLFEAMQEEHRLGPWHAVLLSVAAILHDIGMFISSRNHHKHSWYLIQNSDLFGLSRRDVAIVALVARYHRRNTPRISHQEYAALGHSDRIVVAKLAALLRVADALDRSQTQRIGAIGCRMEQSRFVIAVENVEDLTIEQLGIRNKGDMFEEVYGRSVVLERKEAIRA